MLGRGEVRILIPGLNLPSECTKVGCAGFGFNEFRCSEKRKRRCFRCVQCLRAASFLGRVEPGMHPDCKSRASTRPLLPKAGPCKGPKCHKSIIFPHLVLPIIPPLIHLPSDRSEKTMLASSGGRRGYPHPGQQVTHAGSSNPPSPGWSLSSSKGPDSSFVLSSDQLPLLVFIS